jgi:hypothetical protein
MCLPLQHWLPALSWAAAALPHLAQVQRMRLQAAEGQNVCGTITALDMPATPPGQQQAADMQVWVDVDGRGRVSSSSWLLRRFDVQVSGLGGWVRRWV